VNYGQNIINPNINPNTNININQNMNIYQNTNINQNMNINSNINMYQNNNFSSNSNLNQNSLLNQNTNLTQNQNIGFNQFQNIDFNKNQIMNLNQNINNNFNMNMNQDAKQNLIKNITNTFGNIYAEKQDSPSQNSVQFQQNNSLNDKTDIYGITNEDYVFCGISDKSELGRAKDIKIEVTVGEKVNRKMFSKAYMTYLITTNPLNYKVNRRY
jgi:hypothetical protein